MIRKTLIALAATGAIASGMAATTASSAQAKTFIDIDIGFGGGGGGYGGGYGGCYWDYVTYKKWNWNHTWFKWKHKKVWVCY